MQMCKRPLSYTWDQKYYSWKITYEDRCDINLMPPAAEVSGPTHANPEAQDIVLHIIEALCFFTELTDRLKLAMYRVPHVQ